MHEILLLGGGGHCRSVIDVIEQSKMFKIAGIIDKKELLHSKVLGYSIIGSDEDLQELSKSYKYILICVGQIRSAQRRSELFLELKELGFNLPVIISNRAYVSKHARIDEGTVVMHDAVINANAKIGKNSIINTKALIEHDTVIGNNCHISTGALVNGGVLIEDNCFLGSGAITKESITISKGSFIKAGSVVT